MASGSGHRIGLRTYRGADLCNASILRTRPKGSLTAHGMRPPQCPSRSTAIQYRPQKHVPCLGPRT